MLASIRLTASLAAALLSLTACGGSSGTGSDPQPECAVPADCGADTACRLQTCVAGVCGTADVAAGTALTTQVPGDCLEDRCDGAGAIVSVPLDSDLPTDDGSQCTSDLCSGGAPVHPALPQDTACSQDGGSVCDAVGGCVQCNDATQCPGTDDECQARTCNSNACGVTFTANGVAVSSQTPGDCRERRCNGAGTIVPVALDSDLPADDGSQCTGDLCSAGNPVHPAQPLDTPCSQNGGSLCDGAGACVECTAALQCPGSDDECQTRICSAGSCGLSYATAGITVTAQTPGDCKENVCDGSGGIAPTVNDADLPADDGSQCTSDLCSAGNPVHPAQPLDTPCSQNGGSLCDGAGACVECTAAPQCPGIDDECQTRICSAGSCGLSYATAGITVTAQTPGDCKESVCDGSGGIAPTVNDADLPIDGIECTSDTCSGGVASNPPLPDLTTCSAGVCMDLGYPACVERPYVVSISPADGGTALASAPLAVTFSYSMDPATLTAQTTAGPCTGSVQLSLDDFASCLSFASAAPAMTGGNVVATLQPAPGLLVNRGYKVRVLASATASYGVPMASTYTSSTGFTTASPDTCDGSVVISQLYGGGGGASSAYLYDFVELHNRGTTPAFLTGWSLQYAGATGTSWQVAQLPNGALIPPGGFYLVQLGSTSGGGLPLPTPDGVFATPSLSPNAGKIALTRTPIPIASGLACPPPANLVDFVGYGPTANCFEGAGPVAATSATTAASRNQSGCGESGSNVADFTVAVPAPRNGATPPAPCGCYALNELAGPEAEYCTVQSPTDMVVAPGAATPTVYGRLFEPGLTGSGTASPNVRAELGFGPATVNPEYQSGWTWIPATYAAPVGGTVDEYQAGFNAPASGSYRYAYRFSLDQAVTWTYCDGNVADLGAGQAAGLTFDFATLPVLTVP